MFVVSCAHMHITKKHWVGALVALGIAIFVVWGLVHYMKLLVASTPNGTMVATSTNDGTATSTSTVATSTAAGVVMTGPFPINPGDSISSWDFKSSSSGDTTLVARATADIQNLTALIGKGQYDNYDLYNGIANDYSSLGNGKLAYQFYNKAIQIHPAKGLAYVNLAHFMSQLGAYDTAADAYTKAVAVEPGMLEYHLERLTYLTGQFPEDTARITSALTDASNQFGDNASILSIEARWLTEQGRYADAIKAWQTAKMLSPGKDTTMIDAEIARLKAKQ